MKAAVVIALALVVMSGAAFARHRHQVQDANGNPGMVTVQTAAGIPITVSSSFAPKVTAFIADLVASGYTPKSIRCYARGGHVHGSRHYSGNACDIDQHRRNGTARAMYHATAMATAHGLRDGCSFRDCGHVDDGQPLMRRRHYDAPGTTLVASARSRHHRRAGTAQASMPADRLTQFY
jgi:hypothetical protein